VLSSGLEVPAHVIEMSYDRSGEAPVHGLLQTLCFSCQQVVGLTAIALWRCVLHGGGLSVWCCLPPTLVSALDHF
jgi:hypothetical protein